MGLRQVRSGATEGEGILAQLNPSSDRALLDLLGGARQPMLAGLDWARIATLSELHRLGPLLHWRHGDNAEVPKPIRAGWREAYRLARIAALAQDADLAWAMGLLEAADCTPVALKGAFLARHAYPEPALRPMRDLDLLVPPAQALTAWEVLLAAGATVISPPKIPLAEVIRLEQHLPALELPRGTVLELHVRVSELSGRLEYATPAGREAGLIARAVTVDGQRFPDPTDLLSHLVTHAVYGHRFDCGPLVLSDVAFLTAHQQIDWPRFHATAAADGWAKGAALVLALVREFCSDHAVPEPPKQPDPATLNLAAALLLQDYRRNRTARFLATLLTGGWGYVLRRTSGTVSAEGEAAITVDRSKDGGRWHWAMGHISTFWHDLRDPALRRQTRQLAQFRRWIES
jgi:hypothetical protein